MTILFIKYNLIQYCITALKPTKTDGDISGLDWLGYALVIALSNDCDSLHGLLYAIIAQGRLCELC